MRHSKLISAPENNKTEIYTGGRKEERESERGKGGGRGGRGRERGERYRQTDR